MVDELSGGGRALARKLKLVTFCRNWVIRLVFTKGRHHGWRQEKIERWKTPSWEINISEHGIIQHTKITNENFFLFVYHKLGWYNYGTKINRH